MYAFISSTATASGATGTPGGPSDAIRVGLGIGIPTILVTLFGIIVSAVVAICIARYTTNKKNRSKCQLLTSINLHGNWDKPE